MNHLSEQQVLRITNLVREVEKLSDVEKLLLYLQLPCGQTDLPEGKYKTNASKHGADIFSKKPDQETTQTYTWILSHLEEDQNVSLPKQEVYDEYRQFCQANRFEPLCVADFGKAMKHALPCIKPRRLGQRGNSRYCYSGLRKKYRIEPPSLPDMIELKPVVRQHSNYQQATSLYQQDLATADYNDYPRLNGYDACNAATVGTSSASSISSNTSSASSSSSSSSSSSTSSSSSSSNRQLETFDTPKQESTVVPKQEPGCVSLDNCSPTNPAQQHDDQQQQQQQQLLLHDLSGEPVCCRPEPEPAGVNCSMCLPVANTGMQVYGPAGTNQAPQTASAAAHVTEFGPTVPQHQPATNHHPPLHHNHQQQQHRQLPPQQPPSHHQHQHHHPRYHEPTATNQDCQVRSGTPDDDAYRHSYHDLNRSTISSGPNMIPFSESLSAQLAASHESFLSYATTNPYSSAPVPMAQASYQEQQQTIQTQPAQQQQTQRPQQMQQMRQPTNKGAPIAPLGGNQQMQQQQEAMPECCASSGRLQKQQDKNLEQPVQRQPFGQIGGNGQPLPNAANERAGHHQFEHTSVASKYPTLAHLNLNFNDSAITTSDMDFASPFQSPTSTPYPMISSTNYLTSVTPDYYSGDCNLQYTGEH